jgi:ketosteroid isomerase-like protein
VIVQAATLDVLAEFRERFECYNRHDFDAMEAMYRPNAVFDASRVFPGERPRRGYGEMREYWDEIWEIWEGVRMDPAEVLDVGGDRYVVVVELGGRGKRSGADVARPMAFLYALRDGLIARTDIFPDREAALAAAGEDKIG